METYLSGSMTGRSEKELLEILDNLDIYQQNAIVAAVTELQKRGKNIDQYVDLRKRIIKTQARKEELMKNKFKVPLDLPSTIRKASHLVFFAIIIGIISMIVSEQFFNAGIFKTLKGLITVTISILLTGILAYLLLLGRIVARSLFLILFIGGLLTTIPALIFLFHTNLLIAMFSLLQMVLQLYSLILLYKKESNEWYRKQKELLIVE